MVTIERMPLEQMDMFAAENKHMDVLLSAIFNGCPIEMKVLDRVFKKKNKEKKLIKRLKWREFEIMRMNDEIIARSRRGSFRIGGAMISGTTAYVRLVFTTTRCDFFFFAKSNS